MRRHALLSLLATSALCETLSPAAGSNPGCLGTSTFFGYIPTETVTVTVDGNYTYTAESNGSIPTAAIFYTPPPACESIVLPQNPTVDGSTSPTDTTLSPLLPSSSIVEVFNTTYLSATTWTETFTTNDCANTLTSRTVSTSESTALYANTSTTADTSDASRTSVTSVCGPILRFGTFANTETYSVEITQISYVNTNTQQSVSSTFTGKHPQILTTEPGAPPIVVTATSAAQTSVATVTITKKTPVAVSTTTKPNQIVFSTVAEGSGSLAAVSSKTSAVVKGGNSSNGSENSPSNEPSAPAAASTTGGQNDASTKVNSAGNNNQPTTGAMQISTGGSKISTEAGSNISPAVSVKTPVGLGSDGSPVATIPQGNGIGSITNSAINSPFTSVGVVTSYGPASTTVSLVNGVPVQVMSSSVYIGGSYVAIPTGSSTTLVTVAGQTFTVKPDGVVGGSSTLEIHRSQSISYSAVQAATLAASVVTQNGVVVTIKPTAAVVDGTTYSIGLNAGSTTLTVKGQVITFNSNGVAFASTTYMPAMTTAAAYVVETIAGLTFSIDSSQAIVSGTTYKIGAGAASALVTTEIGGTTVVFGPSGIVLPSTTIAPTGVAFTSGGNSPNPGSISAKVVSGATSGPTISSSGASASSRPPSFLRNSICIVSALLAFGTLPLSLLL